MMMMCLMMMAPSKLLSNPAMEFSLYNINIFYGTQAAASSNGIIVHNEYTYYKAGSILYITCTYRLFCNIYILYYSFLTKLASYDVPVVRLLPENVTAPYCISCVQYHKLR